MIFLDLSMEKRIPFDLLFLAILFFFPLLTSGQKDNKKCIRLPNYLNEVSGLYIEVPGKMWWHNDGGSNPVLYQTDGRGNLLREIKLNTIKNKDWEDITSDDDGRIYIGDFGNNLNQRQDLKIYIYDSDKDQIDSISFTYPDQKYFPPTKENWNFNMEGFFWFQDSLHLFSKNRLQVGNYFTKHYVLPARPGNYEAILVDSIYLKNRVVTGAAISRDKKTVGLIAYTYKKVLGFIPWSAASIYLIRDFSGSRFLQGNIYKKKAPGFILATQMESIDFLNDKTLYIASEKTKFIKQKAKRVRLKKRHFKKSKRIDH